MNTSGLLTTITFDDKGAGHCLYSEAIPLHEIGRLTVERATHIEFDNRQQIWQVNDPSGCTLFAASSRQACLDWERRYFNLKQLPYHGGIHEPMLRNAD